MKTLIRIALLCIFTLGAGSVLAQSVTIATPGGAVTPGQVVVVPLDFTQGSTQIGSLDIRISVSTTQFSAISLDCTSQTIGAAFNLCSNVNAASGQVSIRLSGDGSAQLVTGKLGNLTLTVAPGAVPNAAEPVPGVVEGVGDVLGDDDLPNNTITVTNGSLNISAGPQPAFGSVPTPAQGVALGSVVQNATDPTANVVISNTGDNNSTLTGSCSITNSSGGVFSIIGDPNISAAKPATDTVTVGCDSAGSIANHTGEMTCTHNGGGGDAVYALSCNITAGPQPAFSSTPSDGSLLNFGGVATEQGTTPNPTSSIVVTNTGAASGLTFTCSDTSDPSGAFTVTSGGTVGSPGLGINASSAPVVVTCDASLPPNTYTGTLSCSHNGSNDSPATYPLSCEISEAGAAIFASSPPPGPIDVAGGADVVVGDTDPESTLTFYNNADAGDQVLDLSCNLSGDPEITVIPGLSGGASIAPQFNTSVFFTCDTETSGEFTATYTCDYESGGIEGPAGTSQTSQAVYNLSCNVREKEAQVEPSPPSGTTLSGSIPPGGTASFNVTFPEVNDEGLDASLVSCSLDDGSVFSITAPASFPQTISAGSSVTVTVQGTDPGGAENLTDILSCTFTDSDSEGEVVTYPINVNIGGNAQFHVLKKFTDDNPGNVTVDLDCDTGLILDQSKVIHEDGIGVTFIVSDFDAGELNCNVTERPVAGYSATYDASGSDSDYTDADDNQANPGCYWTEVAGSDFNICVITNSPKAVDLVVTKEWLYPGSASGSDVSDHFELILYCANASIEGGAQIFGDEQQESSAVQQDSCAYDEVSKSQAEQSQLIVLEDLWCKTLSGKGNRVFREKVTPHTWPGGLCVGLEVNVSDAVEVENGCLSALEVSAGSGNSCTITNTVFYEGIPTLSEYGMALLALLMLGMGFVAVRRIA